MTTTTPTARSYLYQTKTKDFWVRTVFWGYCRQDLLTYRDAMRTRFESIGGQGMVLRMKAGRWTFTVHYSVDKVAAAKVRHDEHDDCRFEGSDDHRQALRGLVLAAV